MTESHFYQRYVKESMFYRINLCTMYMTWSKATNMYEKCVEKTYDLLRLTHRFKGHQFRNEIFTTFSVFYIE